MIGIGSDVLVGSTKIEGVVKELGVDSALVVHKILFKGVEKDIEQWYDFGILAELTNKENTPIKSEDTVKQDCIEELNKQESFISSKNKESKQEKNVELGIIPEKHI